MTNQMQIEVYASTGFKINVEANDHSIIVSKIEVVDGQKIEISREIVHAVKLFKLTKETNCGIEVADDKFAIGNYITDCLFNIAPAILANKLIAMIKFASQKILFHISNNMVIAVNYIAFQSAATTIAAGLTVPLFSKPATTSIAITPKRYIPIGCFAPFEVSGVADLNIPKLDISTLVESYKFCLTLQSSDEKDKYAALKQGLWNGEMTGQSFVNELNNGKYPALNETAIASSLFYLTQTLIPWSNSYNLYTTTNGNFVKDDLKQLEISTNENGTPIVTYDGQELTATTTVSQLPFRFTQASTDEDNKVLVPNWRFDNEDQTIVLNLCFGLDTTTPFSFGKICYGMAELEGKSIEVYGVSANYILSDIFQLNTASKPNNNKSNNSKGGLYTVAGVILVFGLCCLACVFFMRLGFQAFATSTAAIRAGGVLTIAGVASIAYIAHKDEEEEENKYNNDTKLFSQTREHLAQQLADGYLNDQITDMGDIDAFIQNHQHSDYIGDLILLSKIKKYIEQIDKNTSIFVKGEGFKQAWDKKLTAIASVMDKENVCLVELLNSYKLPVFGPQEQEVKKELAQLDEEESSIDSTGMNSEDFSSDIKLLTPDNKTKVAKF